MGKLWRRYRGWPLWLQIVVGAFTALMLISIAATPFVEQPEEEQQVSTSDQPDETTTTTERTTTTEEGTTTTERATTTTERPTTSTAQRTTTTASPAKMSTCTDTTGDASGAPPNGDLVSVRLRLTDDALMVTYEMAGDVPSGGETLWSVSASPDPDTSLQLGYKVVGAEQFVFVFDSAAARQENLKPDLAEASGRTVTVSYPAEDVDQLGDEFEYHATMSLNGQDVDQCPGESPLDPGARFPS